MAGRILVIRGGAIGDFILTLPAIRLLRENFPDTHLEILGYRHIAALAEGRFYAHATRSIEYGPLAGFFNPKADLDPELCTYLASFQQVVSYIFDPDRLFEGGLRRAGVKNLITGSPKVNDESHAAYQLARPLEDMALWLDDPAAEFFPSEEDFSASRQVLPASAEPFWAVHPGSGSPTKNWPLEKWTALLTELAKEGRHIVIVGGESDTERLAALKTALPNGRFTVLEHVPLPVLGAVFHRSNFFIGHDSGISHLAAAADARCLLLFGPTDPAVWAPANEHVRVLVAPGGDLSALEVPAVLEKIREVHVR